MAGLTAPAATPAPPPPAPAITAHAAAAIGVAGRTLLANDAAALFRGTDMQPERPAVENGGGSGAPPTLRADRQRGGTAQPW